MKKILAASIITAFVLTGCNTFKGVGKDVSSAGNAVTKTAEKTQDKMSFECLSNLSSSDCLLL